MTEAAPQMTKDEALKQALDDLAALTPKELRDELDRHANGALAVALREAGDFLYNHDPDATKETQ